MSIGYDFIDFCDVIIPVRQYVWTLLFKKIVSYFLIFEWCCIKIYHFIIWYPVLSLCIGIELLTFVAVVQVFTPMSLPDVFESPITNHALVFTNKDREQEHINTISAIQSIAALYRGRMLFVNVPHTESRMTRFFSISESSLPTLIITDDLRNGGRKKWVYPHTLGNHISLDDINEFIELFFNGLLPLTVKSEKVEVEDTQGPVIVVKGLSFDDLVINNNKDIFIEMYAPW